MAVVVARLFDKRSFDQAKAAIRGSRKVARDIRPYRTGWVSEDSNAGQYLAMDKGESDGEFFVIRKVHEGVEKDHNVPRIDRRASDWAWSITGVAEKTDATEKKGRNFQKTRPPSGFSRIERMFCTRSMKMVAGRKTYYTLIQAGNPELKSFFAAFPPEWHAEGWFVVEVRKGETLGAVSVSIRSVNRPEIIEMADHQRAGLEAYWLRLDAQEPPPDA